MADIFISYKREDRKYAKKIAELLTQRGHDVWWDIELLPGDKFADEINVILNKVKATVVLWTPNSKNSPWVKSEALTAFNNNTLIPVLLKNTEIPVPFNTLHTLDLTSWESEGVSSSLNALVTSVEKKVGTRDQAKQVLSDKEIDEALQRPKHELEYWESISSSRNQSIQEYQLYIDKFGEKSTFYDLAQQRIETIKELPKKSYFKDKLTIFSIVMGILVGGFTIANYLGLFKIEEPEPIIDPIPLPKPVLEPKKVILEKHPKTIAITISTWGNGSHTENCVPPLKKKAGYVLVGGELAPAVQYTERYRAGCAPPGHCDSLNEYCTTVDRSAACYVNQAWYNWKTKKLEETADEITYETICES